MYKFSFFTIGDNQPIIEQLYETKEKADIAYLKHRDELVEILIRRNVHIQIQILGGDHTDYMIYGIEIPSQGQKYRWIVEQYNRSIPEGIPPSGNDE